jgi:hypothetical protein
LILLNGDKVTLVALPDSLICTNICDSHPNNITGAMESGDATCFPVLGYDPAVVWHHCPLTAMLNGRYREGSR